MSAWAVEVSPGLYLTPLGRTTDDPDRADTSPSREDARIAAEACSAALARPWRLGSLPDAATAADLQPGDTVKAISLRQPWASLVALGIKKIETRSWRTHHRGPILICATQARSIRRMIQDHGALLDLLVPHYLSEVERATLKEHYPDWRAAATARQMTAYSLPYGQAVCLVDLRRIMPTENIRTILSTAELESGDYGDDRYAWLIDRGLRRLKPFRVTGRQRLFWVTLPDFREVE